MSSANLFIVTHPRSTSTALERAFITRQNDTTCIHEPFGEPYYYGPSRLSGRFSPEQCKASGYSELHFPDVVEKIEHSKTEKPNLVIKDMAQYIIPPVNPSKLSKYSSVPTDKQIMVDSDFLEAFKYVYLIRSPHLAVPSYFRCCIPPLSERTGFEYYDASEAGLAELRKMYDMRNHEGLVIDSSDLCRDPETVIKRVCEYAGIEFTPEMLDWDMDEQGTEKMVKAFEKWNGFHDDALQSKGFKNNQTKSAKPTETKNSEFTVDFESWENDWKKKYTDEQVKVIKQAVQDNLDDYLYLRQFREIF